MRTLLALVLSLVLTACSCDLAGCFGGLVVRVDRQAFETDATYLLKTCIDGECRESEHQIAEDYDPYEMLVPIDSDIRMEGDAFVTVELWDTNGNLVGEFAGDVEFSENRPNGRWCDPTCWRGQVDLSK